MDLSITSGGDAWHNTKKFIEDGNQGAKGLDTHMSVVIGDTVCDPYKDTAGPTANLMIEVINSVALPILAALAGFCALPALTCAGVAGFIA